MRFDTKLGNGVFLILCIPCDFFACTTMIEKTCIYCITSKKCYQPVTNCIYLSVLGSYNNWNIIDLAPKLTPFEAIDGINQVDLDRISDYMASLVQWVMCGAINTDETTTNVLHVIQFIS